MKQKDHLSLQNKEEHFWKKSANPLINLLAPYKTSIFQDFDCVLRTEVGLVEDDTSLVSDEYNSSFNTYEITPGIYNFIKLSEVLLRNLQIANNDTQSITIETDDLT